MYVIDANTGTIIKTFSTTRSVAADVAVIAVATAGSIDHAYAADTGGNIYRIDFASPVTIGSSTASPTPTAPDESSCSLRRCWRHPEAGIRGPRIGRPRAPTAERIPLTAP